MLTLNLVLEGGAMRGMFTAGVLDSLDEQNLIFDYVIGVSAGACMGVSYVTRQRGRSRNINISYCRDPRYFSYRNLLKEGNLFSVQFTYEEVPRRLIPFDYQAFEESPIHFVTAATDCETGQPVYLSNDRDMIQEIRASASMPLFSKPVEIGGRFLLDGGASDSIPVRHAMEEGHPKSVVILTRPKGYRKKIKSNSLLYRIMLPKYPRLAEAMNNRPRVYNQQLDDIETLEKAGSCIAVYPPADIIVDRLERDREKLEALYQAGLKAGAELGKKLPQFLLDNKS
ncbi:patatin family protein [Spirochaetia bacterium]|nr:patatin family protein [Spirochaetia bacterium]